jgi:4-amino-4-deoxy-L-arabinose transferase-like glycosyltransferase
MNMRNGKIEIKKILLIIFIVSLIIRISYGFIIYNKNHTSKFVDDWQYITYAKHIINQGIFVPDIERLNQDIFVQDELSVGEASILGPGFPLIAATTFLFFGESFLPIIFLNALVSSILCLLIFYLGKELFNETVGLIASTWSIFYVLYIKYTPRVLKENWLFFLFALCILLFLKATKKKQIKTNFFIFSLVYAFLIHMDERFFTYLPILCIGFIFLDTSSRKNGLKKAFLFFTIVLVTMIPWLIRNFKVYNRPVILTERTTKFTDQLFGYTKKTKEKSLKEKVKITQLKEATRLIREGKEVPFYVPRLENLKKAVKLGYIPHPYNRLERWYAEFKELWRPVRFSGGFVGNGYRFEGPAWSLKHNLSVGITYGLLLPFFILGMVSILRNKNKKGIFIIILIVIHTIIHVVMAHARNRYRIPVDSLIITTAFFGLHQLYLNFRRWRIVNLFPVLNSQDKRKPSGNPK